MCAIDKVYHFGIHHYNHIMYMLISYWKAIPCLYKISVIYYAINLILSLNIKNIYGFFLKISKNSFIAEDVLLLYIYLNNDSCRPSGNFQFANLKDDVILFMYVQIPRSCFIFLYINVTVHQRKTDNVSIIH